VIAEAGIFIRHMHICDIQQTATKHWRQLGICLSQIKQSVWRSGKETNLEWKKPDKMDNTAAEHHVTCIYRQVADNLSDGNSMTW